MTLPLPFTWPPPIPGSGTAGPPGPPGPVGPVGPAGAAGVAGASGAGGLSAFDVDGVDDPLIATPDSGGVSNRSAVAGVSVSDALNSLRGANTFAAEFVAPPAVPNAFDFNAALATNPDLAANGFLVHLQNSPWTTLTRSGDVDMFDALGPAANTYQSTLIGGLLLARFPIGVSAVITKQISTAAAGLTLKTHAWLTRLFDSTNATAGLLLTWYIGGLANPAGAAQYGAAGTQTVYAGILNQHWDVTSWAVGSFPISLQNVNVGTDFGDVVNYLRLAQQAANQLFAIRAGTPISFLMPATPLTGSMTLPPDRAGLIVNNGTGQFVMIDFIRLLPFGQFP